MTASPSSVRFSDLGVPAPMVDVLVQQGKETAFPIQVDTLPDSLRGKDVLGRGRTGSGKTIAFAIPLAARLAASPRGRRAGRPRALVLAPTRELATQIDATLAPLAKAMGLNTTTIFGGVGQGRQVDALRGGVDVVVACPGRLADLMQQGHVHLDGIEVTVLDEADHMADMGFLPGVTKIMQATPEQGQRLLFSATLDNGVDKLVKKFLHSPVMHSVDDETSPVEAMTHHLFEVADADAKKDLVRTLASGTGRRILFMRTKHHAKRLAKQLTSQGIPAVDLQGNLSQGARERNLAKFSSGEALVLVATDVAARGVHVDHVELVVHVDPPTEHKAYLHRSGRTARAGSSGDVVTVTLPAERRDVAQMMRAAAISVKPQQVTATSPAVTELVGEVAPIRHVEEQPVQQQQRQRAPRAESAGSGSEGGGRRRGRGGRSGGAAQPASTGASGTSGRSGNGRGGRSASGRGAAAAPASAAPATGGQRRGGSGRRASSDVVRGGSSAVWSSEGGYVGGRSAGSESGGARRRSGSRRASRPAGSADRH
ncbi:DEAD/DEAH box helicase [Curtobacterium sp. C1]|uniref:DEAD/DEAH box helicase n=1 Tax=Curtobacterium TaxID=2034 RepID=UPI00073647F5|nr:MULTISPECIES: DEAD/DEAH box helicase [Curtobacterium]MCS5488113.1 DEAD/DEAH box helicase [Curtobacterium flaccumfaciens pv. basellae]KTR10424.1 DEAD/DEAH box helicase [Curtobacterium citreum]MDK8173459.1 DEAD/DEAH box helicase [Curtobacterium citreum]UFU13952.1 DEAD/DEAH box helicase [Curtobacterium sp. C1]WIJ45168.1 DEAD/DEAH box helicase [Curtobacterium citreum]